jgi:hypothetical protein
MPTCCGHPRNKYVLSKCSLKTAVTEQIRRHHLQLPHLPLAQPQSPDTGVFCETESASVLQTAPLEKYMTMCAASHCWQQFIHTQKAQPTGQPQLRPSQTFSATRRTQISTGCALPHLTVRAARRPCRCQVAAAPAPLTPAQPTIAKRSDGSQAHLIALAARRPCRCPKAAAPAPLTPTQPTASQPKLLPSLLTWQRRQQLCYVVARKQQPQHHSPLPNQWH